MATDAPTQPDEAGPVADMSPKAVKERNTQGPFEILVMPDDSNPPLPPEVWYEPPAGSRLPE